MKYFPLLWPLCTNKQTLAKYNRIIVVLIFNILELYTVISVCNTKDFDSDIMLRVLYK